MGATKYFLSDILKRNMTIYYLTKMNALQPLTLQV